MKDRFKIASIIIVLLLAVTLITNFIFWQYPLQYLSYRTGLKAEIINNLLEERHGRLTFPESEREVICKNFNSKEIVSAYGGLYIFSFGLIGVSFFAFVFFALALRFSKINSFKASNKFAIMSMVVLFASFYMFISMDLREWDLDFWFMCGGSIPMEYLFS
jgi:hypothetical protein